jgi:phenylacetic acid degradation operon negative regulatory protein
MGTPTPLAPDPSPGPSTRTALTRRHAAGAASARGMLFTVLGEFVLPTGGSAWTSAFIETFARLGVEEKAIRQALARTAADGWIRPQRYGRRTRWRLTPAGDRLLTEGTERIYAFAGSQPAWDGTWLLVLARAPESDRAARQLLRTRLSWAGLGSPAPGVWITTHADRQDEVRQVLRQAGVTDGQVFTAEHLGGDLPALVAQAWDLPAIERRYEEFLAEFASPEIASPVLAQPELAQPGSAQAASAPSGSAQPGSGQSGAPDPLVRLIELVHAWRRFPAIDPGLPDRLLPRRWSGQSAAELFAARHGQWSAAAVTSWKALDEPR